MGPIGGPATSANNSLRCITSLKTEDLVYTAAETWNENSWAAVKLLLELGELIAEKSCEIITNTSVVSYISWRMHKFFQQKKNIVARSVIRNNFHGEGPQILGTTTKIPVATPIWRPKFVHPCLYECNYGCQEWILLLRNEAVVPGALCGWVCISSSLQVKYEVLWETSTVIVSVNRLWTSRFSAEHNIARGTY